MDVPDEVYISELRKFRPRVISSFNSTKKWPEVSKTELLSWKSKAGLQVEGLLTYPSGYKKGEKYPLAASPVQLQSDNSVFCRDWLCWSPI